MTVMTPEPATGTPVRQGITSRLLVPGFWATVSIVTIWLAVLFIGIFGGDMTFTNSSPQVTVMPSAVAVAFFAAIATASVAKRAFDPRRLGPFRRVRGRSHDAVGRLTRGNRAERSTGLLILVPLVPGRPAGSPYRQPAGSAVLEPARPPEVP